MPDTSVFLWDRQFLLCSSGYVLDRQERPYRRPSATVIVSLDRPFRFKAGGRCEAEYAGVLIAPNMLRERVDAKECRIQLLDIGLATPAFMRLAPALPEAGLRALSDRELEQCREAASRFDPDSLSCADARCIFDAIVAHIAGSSSGARVLDGRIARALELVEAHSFDEISVGEIAARVGVSESRLRTLFRAETGCTLSQVRRWENAWKALRLLRDDMSFTEAAHAAGFFDLAHLDRALSEFFGRSPREIVGGWDTIRGSNWRFHQCEDR